MKKKKVNKGRKKLKVAISKSALLADIKNIVRQEIRNEIKYISNAVASEVLKQFKFG